jgi:iron uptake system component EfeO
VNTYVPLRRATVLAAMTALGLATAACSSPPPPPNKPGEGGEVTIELTPEGCRPTPASLKAGTVTFTVRNAGATNVTEAELLAGGKSLAEKEDLTPGHSGEFKVHLNAGDYQISCPGAQHDKADFKVTG